MSRLLIFSVCILFLFTSAGCKNEKIRNGDDELKLENNSWNLLSYGFKDEGLKDIPASKSSTLYFNAESNTVSGAVLCNSFESAYSKTESDISIVSISPTELNCGEDEEGLASFIVTTLISIDSYEINSNRLIIYSVESRMLEYGKE